MNENSYALAKKIISVSAAQGIKLALAESCTGGMLAAALTDIAGASAAFLGSAVTYSNEAKERVLGVQKEIIIEYGAVSGECARQMARGALRVFGADVALSVTGIAGPDGGTPEKPVGTVWFGVASREREESFVRLFQGTREKIRAAAVGVALTSLLEELRQEMSR